MSNVETLAYFLEEDSLRDLMATWPAGMQLMLVLDDDGRCDLMVHHRDEAGRVLDKLIADLGELASGLSVTPQVPGRPTRKVKFSDEQQLLALVAEAEDLRETATDYAINYRFACDEGLDPEVLTGRSAELDEKDEILLEAADEIDETFNVAKVETGEKALAVAREILDLAKNDRVVAYPVSKTGKAIEQRNEPKVTVRAPVEQDSPKAAQTAANKKPEAAMVTKPVEKSAPDAPRLAVVPTETGVGRSAADEDTQGAADTTGAHSATDEASDDRPRRPIMVIRSPSAQAPAAQGEFPVGYHEASATETMECSFVTARIAGQGGRIRVTLEPSLLTGRELPLPVERVGHSADFSRFALPRQALLDWDGDRALVLDIPQHLFPKALAAKFCAQPYEAAVTITRQGVFVAAGAVMESLPATASSAKSDLLPSIASAAPRHDASTKGRRARWRVGRPVKTAIGASVAVLVSGTLAAAWNPVLFPEAAPTRLSQTVSDPGLAALVAFGEATLPDRK